MNDRHVTTLQREPGVARPVEPGMNRRAMLAGVSAAVVLGAAPGVASAAAGQATPTLAELIEAHRLAYANYGHALEVWDALEQRFRDRGAARIPMSISANGEHLSGYRELRSDNEHQLRREIVDTHKRILEIHTSRWVRSMVPDYVAAVEHEVGAAEQRTLAYLDAVLAQDKAARAASGVDEADEEVARTSTAERRALAALLAYRPASPAEREVKTDYITAHEDYAGVPVFDDEDTVSMLIDLLNEVA